MVPGPSVLTSRRLVWLALSDLFLDTDVQLLRTANSQVLAASPYSLEELDKILREEVSPACAFNLTLVAGEWAGFDAGWLERRILRGELSPRPREPWWRRCLLPDWLLPWRIPAEWADWRTEVARLRAPPASAV